MTFEFKIFFPLNLKAFLHCALLTGVDERNLINVSLNLLLLRADPIFFSSGDLFFCKYPQVVKFTRICLDLIFHSLLCFIHHYPHICLCCHLIYRSFTVLEEPHTDPIIVMDLIPLAVLYFHSKGFGEGREANAGD